MSALVFTDRYRCVYRKYDGVQFLCVALSISSCVSARTYQYMRNTCTRGLLLLLCLLRSIDLPIRFAWSRFSVLVPDFRLNRRGTKSATNRMSFSLPTVVLVVIGTPAPLADDTVRIPIDSPFPHGCLYFAALFIGIFLSRGRPSFGNLRLPLIRRRSEASVEGVGPFARTASGDSIPFI